MGEWSERPVVVTGAGGFIGSHLVEELVRRGARLRAFVRYNSRGARGALELLPAEVLSELEVSFGDIRSRDSVADAFRGSEVAFHLAAAIAIPYSYVDPTSVFETNVTGTLNVVQAARSEGLGKLVHTSTSEVYGTAQEVPITERHPLSAQSPYAASKVGADSLALSFHRSFELPVTVLRPFNTYGPRQSARAVIPTIISQALTGGSLRLGSLEPRRDFTYVSDTVAGFLAVADSEDAVGQTLQLGTGTDVSVGELVDELGDVLGRELPVELDEQRMRPEGSEVMRLISSPERVEQVAGWRPQVGLREGLTRTVEWVRDHPEMYRVDEYAI
jgi:NAD dependent epimerase/dehydratase